MNEPPPAAITTTLATNCSPGVGDELEAAVVHALQGIDPLLQMEGGIERLDLRHQGVGQPLAGDDRQSRNVVDRLFGIQLGALAAGLVQDVDDVGLDVDQAQLEHGKQPDRPRADDDGIRLDDRRAR